MPKAIVFGNGDMLVNLDENLLMRDFYYPYVGLEEHTTFGNYHYIGFYSEGKFSWLNDGNWQINIGYAKDSLTGNSLAINKKLGISVLFEDFVYTSNSVFFRKLTIKNLLKKKREIRVFSSHNFYIYGDKLQDTAEYEPKLQAVLNYRQNRYFLVNGCWEYGEGMDQYTVGKNNFNYLKGTYKDAEDGDLSLNPIEQGSVDSTVRFSENFEPDEEKILYTWILAAKNYEETCEVNKKIFELTPGIIYEHTKNYWINWANKENMDFGDLPEDVVNLYKRSLLIVRTQIDNRGAILAANDTDIMKFNRDTYSYMWPRDGAFVSMALADAGYPNLCEKFFYFCRDALTRDGYMLNKYHPDGSTGSSWHPKYKNGEVQLPIQEDETALVLVALRKYYEKYRSIEVIRELFGDMILKMADWLSSYTDETTGLPLPSYDLWERERDVHTYTSASVYAGLKAAAYLSEITGHLRSAKIYDHKAERIRDAILKYLYSEEDGRFLRSVSLRNGKITARNNIVDASVSQVWAMGVLPADDYRVRQTMEAINIYLTVSTNIGGLARYVNDDYHYDFNKLSFREVTGNPWIITTLWETDYQIENAKRKKDLEIPQRTLKWVVKMANSAGILPEQMHPITGEALSVAPLTWSHASFISTVLKYLHKLKELS